jgi:UDP-glucose:tetrahydrobiopterin glucosyltransferase
VRVAIVAPLVSPLRERQSGGSQAFVSALARGLVDRGHDVHLYAAAGSEVRGVEVIDTGVDHRELASTRFRASGPAAGEYALAARSFARLYAALRENTYDVVHNHAFDAPAVREACALSAPVVHTVHLPPERAVAAALRHAVRCDPAPMVACVSAHQAQAWRGLVSVDAILPPLIPTTQIPFSPAAGFGAVFAGRLSREKGAAEAIAIAAMAGIRLELFGDVYDPEYARAQIEPKRAEPAVVVHEGVSQTTLWEAIARAAVALCPATWDEPFGMVAAEAQACGTPVVAFRRGALDEVIVDGVTGYLVAADDLRAAADAVSRAPALSRRACREHAERELDLECSLDAHEQLYKRAARAYPGGRVGG